LGQQHRAYQDKRQPLTSYDEAPATTPDEDIRAYANDGIQCHKASETNLHTSHLLSPLRFYLLV
jgi:hypothetical protein